MTQSPDHLKWLKLVLGIVVAIITVGSAFSGVLFFVAGISAKVDIAVAKNTEQDQRLERQKDFMQKQQDLLLEIKDSAARTETKVNILLEKSK
jgi:uncharacterized protein involved in cysteine biosynthesis